MNIKQKVAAITGLLIMAAMGLYPPWDAVVDHLNLHVKKPIGYSLLFEPPENPKGWYQASSVKIAYSRLALQWGIIAVVSAAAIILTKETPKPPL